MPSDTLKLSVGYPDLRKGIGKIEYIATVDRLDSC